jgi:hypothetical protein
MLRKEKFMSRTSKLLEEERSRFGATLPGYLWRLAQDQRWMASRRVSVEVTTSDSVGGLCPPIRQRSIEDCGWGVRLESLVLRQNGGTWEVVDNYLQADEAVLAAVWEWQDLERLEEAVDQRLARELRLHEIESTNVAAPKWWQCSVCSADLRDKPVTMCGSCRATLRAELAEEEDDDDSFWG